jgi:splicing factor 1
MMTNSISYVYFRLSRPGAAGPPAVNYDDKAKIDEEYLSLMAELGQGKDEDRMNNPRMHSRPSNSGSIFEKASAPKAIMAPAPLMSQSIPAPPPPSNTSGKLQTKLTELIHN